MTLIRVTGLFLVALPIAFNVFFLLLGRTFDYPGILRGSTETIMRRFLAGGSGLRVLWQGFALTAVLFAPLAVLVGQVLAREGLEIVPVATTFGVLAAIVQFLGLIRWPYLVPFLARSYLDPKSSEATRQASEVVFQAFHRYAGVAVGEHLGYLFTGLWTLLVGIAVTNSASYPAWFGWLGAALGLVLIIGSFEFAGSFEETGWPLAGTLVPIAYILWSVWLVGAGVGLLLQ
jgi:hypothetical protein